MESYHGNYYYPEGIVSLSPFLFQKILNTPLLVILYFSLLFFLGGGGGDIIQPIKEFEFSPQCCTFCTLN